MVQFGARNRQLGEATSCTQPINGTHEGDDLSTSHGKSETDGMRCIWKRNWCCAYDHAIGSAIKFRRDETSCRQISSFCYVASLHPSFICYWTFLANIEFVSVDRSDSWEMILYVFYLIKVQRKLDPEKVGESGTAHWKMTLEKTSDAAMARSCSWRWKSPMISPTSERSTLLTQLSTQHCQLVTETVQESKNLVKSLAFHNEGWIRHDQFSFLLLHNDDTGAQQSAYSSQAYRH